VSMSFDAFALAAGPRLRGALVAAYGPEVGADAAADSLAYGWEHWDRVGRMSNPVGYLYRVGQTSARRSRQREGFTGALIDQSAVAVLPEFEPGLAPALAKLSEQQRVVVVMVHALGWGQTEVAEILEMSPSSVRTHLARGMARLQKLLEVDRVR
jgi:RNA polymerase sigma-70 factor, ECF subfamily